MDNIEKNQGLLTQEEILDAQMFQDFEDFGYVKLFEAGRGKPPKGMKWVESKSGNVYAVKVDGRSKAKKATDTGKKPTEPKKSTKPTTDEETEVKKTKTVKLSPGKGDPFPEPKQFDPNSKENMHLTGNDLIKAQQDYNNKNIKAKIEWDNKLAKYNEKKDRVKSAAIKLKKSANNELETIETKNKKQENAKKIIANSVEKVQNKISSNLEKNEDVDLDEIIVDEFGNAMEEFAKTNPKEEDFDETTSVTVRPKQETSIVKTERTEEEYNDKNQTYEEQIKKAINRMNSLDDDDEDDKKEKLELVNRIKKLRKDKEYWTNLYNNGDKEVAKVNEKLKLAIDKIADADDEKEEKALKNEIVALKKEKNKIITDLQELEFDVSEYEDDEDEYEDEDKDILEKDISRLKGKLKLMKGKSSPEKIKEIKNRIAKLESRKEKFGISSVSDYEDYIKNKITTKIKALPGFKWMKFAFFSVFSPFKKLSGFLDDLYEKSEAER